MSCGKPSSATLSYRLKVAGNIHIPGGHQLYFPLYAVTYRQTDDNRASGLLSSPWFRSSTTYRQPAARQALSPARKKSSSAPVSGPVQYICSPLAPAPAPDSSARINKCLFPSLPMPPQEPKTATTDAAKGVVQLSAGGAGILRATAQIPAVQIRTYAAPLSAPTS